MSRRDLIVNAVLFQLVWVACVGGGAAGRWWLGPLAVLAFALWQVPRSPHPRAELTLVALAAVLGAGVDSALVLGGLLRFPSTGPWPLPAPVWIVALWVGFALTLNHSLAWLKGRTVIAVILGAVAGPFSYWVGATAWQAVTFTVATPVVLATLAVVWAIATPALLHLAEWAVATCRVPALKAAVTPVVED